MAPKTGLALKGASGPAGLPRVSLARELFAAVAFCLVTTSPLWAFDWIGANRQEVAKMTPAEKEELNEKYEKFLALPAQQQEQLRLLHQQLEIDPTGDRLRRVMQRYYDWLKNLNTREQGGLLALTSDADRLAMITKLKQEQETQAAKLSGGSHITRPDLQVISDWVKKYATAHEAELRKEPPQRSHGAPFGGPGEQGHERMAQNRAWWIWTRDKTPPLSAEEIDDLATHLSPKPRAAITSQPTLHDKADLIHRWLQAIAWTRFTARQGMNVKPAVLAQFFETLPKAKQAELLKISDPDEQRHELRKLYFQYRRNNGPSPGGPSPGGPSPGAASTGVSADGSSAGSPASKNSGSAEPKSAQPPDKTAPDKAAPNKSAPDKSAPNKSVPETASKAASPD